ncbi:hypothetical protein Tco_0649481 [Tanacetum coccineum]
MSEPAELIPSPTTSVVRNTVEKGNEQISKNLNRPASYAALREYCDKHYHQLLPIIAKKSPPKKVQQEKLKEVKARLNFEGCFGMKLEDPRGVTTLRIQNAERQNRLGTGWEVKEEGTGEYSIRWEVKERVCSHTRKAVTRVPAQKEWNSFPKNITTKERVYGGQRCSSKVKIAEEDTRNQN